MNYFTYTDSIKYKATILQQTLFIFSTVFVIKQDKNVIDIVISKLRNLIAYFYEDRISWSFQITTNNVHATTKIVIEQDKNISEHS